MELEEKRNSTVRKQKKSKKSDPTEEDLHEAERAAKKSVSKPSLALV